MFEGVIIPQLQKAYILNPDGVRRLARFVGCPSLDNVYKIYEYCRKQPRATKIIDRRA